MAEGNALPNQSITAPASPPRRNRATEVMIDPPSTKFIAKTCSENVSISRPHSSHGGAGIGRGSASGMVAVKIANMSPLLCNEVFRQRVPLAVGPLEGGHHRIALGKMTDDRVQILFALPGDALRDGERCRRTVAHGA